MINETPIYPVRIGSLAFFEDGQDRRVQLPLQRKVCALHGKNTWYFKKPFNKRYLGFLLLCFPALALALTLVGCAPRFGASEQTRNRAPVSTTVAPGQSLALRLESGGTATVTAGQPYVSALGEECVQISGQYRAGAACLRNGEWIGLQDIFVPRPGDGAVP